MVKDEYVVFQYKKDLSPCIVAKNRIKEVNRIDKTTTEIVLSPLKRGRGHTGRAVEVLGGYYEVLNKIAGDEYD